MSVKRSLVLDIARFSGHCTRGAGIKEMIACIAGAGKLVMRRRTLDFAGQTNIKYGKRKS